MTRTRLLILLALLFALPAAAHADDPVCAEAGELADGWQQLADDFRAFATSDDATQADADALMTRTGELTQASADLYGRTQERFAQADHFGEVLERLSGASADEALEVMEDMAVSLTRLEDVCLNRGDDAQAEATEAAYTKAVSAAILQHWSPAEAFDGGGGAIIRTTLRLTLDAQGGLVSATPLEAGVAHDGVEASIFATLDAVTPFPVPPTALQSEDGQTQLVLAFEFDPESESYRVFRP